MSEPRKNHLAIDGGQVKEDEHISSYKPIPESDADLRTSKSNLGKSKEKLSSDGAEEKLLQKEDEAKITTRVDMADAKYVVGDHRNGDAKIELDANKRQFSGLTKEELMKYADDPYWVRLRWFMFALFWTLWLSMLAGAIAIIVQAPKCVPPPPKTWFEMGPLSDFSGDVIDDYTPLEAELPRLEASNVPGIFITPCKDTYEVLEASSCLDKLKEFVEVAKKHSVNVIVDLTANFVSNTHEWFVQSENGSDVYRDFFVWGKSTESDGTRPQAPNTWVSTLNQPAWTWSDKRKEYYLHQFGEDQPDLNFHNKLVVEKFDGVLKKVMEAGVAGVRLVKARQLLVSRNLTSELRDERLGKLTGSDHTQYVYYQHRHTSDQPELDDLLAHWSYLVAQASTEPTVFTLKEDGLLSPELYLLKHNTSSLRPPSAAPLPVAGDVSVVADNIRRRVVNWSALYLTSQSEDPESELELANFAVLLPAAPVLGPNQLHAEDNETAEHEKFSHLVSLRSDASIQHGEAVIADVPAVDSSGRLLACARWKQGHTGYAAVYNPGESPARANLTGLSSLPEALTVHHVSHRVRQATNYTNNYEVDTSDILVPERSTVVLSYVPKLDAVK